MKKIIIGQLVREGGPLGPISRVVGYNSVTKCYKLVGVQINNSIGWLTADYLYPVNNKTKYEQLTLF